jgi:hypothetical protein
VASDDGTSRRELIGLGLAGGLGVFAASLLAPGTGRAVTVTDPQLVSALYESEQLAAFAYQHVLRGGLLTPATHVVVRPILKQERAHVHTLGNALDRLGAPLPQRLTNVTNVDKLLAASRQTGSLGQLTSERDALMLLIRLEFSLEGFYYKALSKLQDGQLASILAQVLANEAQHACVLSELLRPDNVDKAVPSAFVQG